MNPKLWFAGISLWGLLVILVGIWSPANALAREPELLMFMNYPYQITGEDSTRIHVTAFKPDFTPAAGAVVKVDGKNVGTMDEHGVGIFSFVPGSREQHKLEIRLKDKNRTYKLKKSFACNSRTASFRSDQVFVYTDRGVYNPGDVIQIRVLAWELLGEYKALNKASLKLLLQNTAGRVFGGGEVTTDEFGVASMELPLPDHMPKGNYELVVLYKDARESAMLRIERFIPPLMEIKHDLKRYLTPAQTELGSRVNLSYFSGGLPKGAWMGLTVLDGKGSSVFSRDLTAVEPGRFDLKLTGEELDRIRSGLELEAPFKMVLKARDQLGLTSEVTRDMVFTGTPYTAVLEMDKDDYPQGEEVVLIARVVDLDGKPVRELDLTCKKDGKEIASARTSEAGIAEFRFKMYSSAFDASVMDNKLGVLLAVRRIRFNAEKPMTSKVLETPVTAGLETNFKVTFSKDFVPVEKVVHVDLTDISGALVASGTIPVLKDGNTYRAEGKLASPTWGTMLANLYVAAARTSDISKGRKLSSRNVGFITEGQHVTLIPGISMEVVFEDLKPKVRPGEVIDLKVRIKSLLGGEAAVGLSVIDKAVISLLDPLEVTPRDHFYNPQRKVISTGGSAVLTWPVVDRNWGEPWRDIAYTNWGFKEPGRMVRTDVSEEVEGEVLGSGGGSGMGSGTMAFGGLKMEKKASAKVKSIISTKSEEKSLPKHKNGKPKKYDFSEMQIDGDLVAPESADMGPAVLMDSVAASPAPPAEPEPFGGENRASSKPQPRIVIRTDFPDTALWQPGARTRNGVVSAKVRIPDSITIQKVSVVASDAKGNVALGSADIEVNQEVFGRLDLPPVMSMGDRVQVSAMLRNYTQSEVLGSAALGCKGCSVVGDSTLPVRIPADGMVAVSWTINPERPGMAELTLLLDTPVIRDQETRKVMVQPAGTQVFVRRSGWSKDGIFEATVQGGEGRSSALSVIFPEQVSGLQIWSLSSENLGLWYGISGVANQAIMDSAVIQWGAKHELPEATRARIRSRMKKQALTLAMSQGAGGGWGWYYLADAAHPGGWTGENVYMTLQALRALLDLKEADILVPDEVLTSAMLFLSGKRTKDGVWASEDAFFWEKNAPEADLGLTAEIFHQLVRAEQLTGQKAPSQLLTGLRDLLLDKLKGGMDEPAVWANTCLGLMVLDRWTGKKEHADFIANSIGRLIELKRRSAWEPHWYHAYGGMVELNALILELLLETGAVEHAGLIHEVTEYLLSTRESWGAWHNEVGTSNAVRALLKIASGPAVAAPFMLNVEVNSRVVKSVQIDPSNLMMSSLELSWFDLTSALQDGDNSVRITADKGPVPWVEVVTESWTPDPEIEGPPLMLLDRTAPNSLAMGQAGEVSLEVSSPRKIALVNLVEGIPSNLVVDQASLEELVTQGRILGYDLEPGRMVLALPEVGDSVSLKYRVFASRTGKAVHPGTSLEPRYDRKVGSTTLAGEEILVTD